ncbi:MAG TPA: helix-turn-helix domain-containing protein [Ktedonobacterales bacterium]|nr:helix-turn-helix domain-containing protein [Ktedonobacterales bacterium]
MAVMTDVSVTRPEQYLWTLDDVALALRMSRAQVERAVARQEIASVKVGRLRRVTRSQLEAYCRRLERQSA